MSSIPSLICWTCEKCRRSGLVRHRDGENLKEAVDQHHRERTQRCSGDPVIWPDVSCDLVPMQMDYRRTIDVLAAVRKALATGEA